MTASLLVNAPDTYLEYKRFFLGIGNKNLFFFILILVCVKSNVRKRSYDTGQISKAWRSFTYKKKKLPNLRGLANVTVTLLHKVKFFV